MNRPEYPPTGHVGYIEWTVHGRTYIYEDDPMAEQMDALESTGLSRLIDQDDVVALHTDWVPNRP